MKYCYILLFFFITSNLSAQSHPTCDGSRYMTEVFTDTESTLNLKYGEGNTIAGNFQELFMDVYEPVGDQAEARPAVVLAFGGSFITGTRQDLDWLCKAFAKRGFVAVTIDYRLYDLGIIPLPTAEEMQEVVVRSISDMKAAVRYLREDADTDNAFRVDSNLIFVGGVSAGAITAAHTAMMDSTDTYPQEIADLIELIGGIDGNTSDNTQYSSDVQGLVNFSGGLNDATWIDAEDPPLVSIHEEFDPIVPYEGDFASIFNIPIIYMEGSSLLKHVADSVGLRNELWTIEGSDDHVGYFSGANGVSDAMDFATEFLHEIICEGVSDVDDLQANSLEFEVFPNPTSGWIQIKTENFLPLNSKLSNALGQQIGYWENTNEINLSALSPGVYFLNVYSESTQEMGMRRVIIER